MKKQKSFLLLALCMVLSLLPLGDVKVQAANYSDDGWSYDGDSKTLTIHDENGPFALSESDYSQTVKTNTQTVVIENGITQIISGAFYEFQSLTSVTIPDTVTSIGHIAFWGCKSLTDITIPTSVISIDQNAFLFCDNLKSVYFKGNYNSQMQNGIDSIPTSAIIYYNYKATGWSGRAKPAYYIKSNLTNVTITYGLFDYMDVDAAYDLLFQLEPKSGYYLPDTISVTVDGSELVAGEDFTYIGSGSAGFGNLTIPNNQITGDIELTVVAPTYGVTNSLTDLTINGANDAPLASGNVAVDYTAMLTATNEKFLPHTISVTSNGSMLTADDDYVYNRSNGTITIYKESITGDIEITAVAITGYRIFNNLTDISTSHEASVVDIEASGYAISDYTATLTANSGYLPTTISVTVGGTALEADDYTYTRTTATSGTITIPKNLITGDVRITATSIENYKVTNRLTNITSDGANTVAVDTDTTAIADYTATLTATIGYLPTTISVKVNDTELAREAYTYNYLTGELTIKKEHITGDVEITAVATSGQDIVVVISVGGNTTGGDSLSDSLRGFNLSTITELTIIDGVFTTDDWNYLSLLYALENFEINSRVDSVAAMPNGASGAPIFPSTIKTVILEYVERIGDYAFYECAILGTVNAPELTVVGDYAFYNCDGLHSITYGEAITSIGDFAFYDCLSINRSFRDPIDPYSGISHSLPIGLTSVGESAFARTPESGGGLMTEIIMPEIESIGANAFKGRDRLADIKMGVTPPTTVGTDAFSDINENAAITPVGANGNTLDTAEYDVAITAYRAANDGNTADYFFHGVALKARTSLIKYVDNRGDTHYIENEKLADLNDYDLDFSNVKELEILSGTFTTADWDKLKAVVGNAVYTKFVIHDAVTSVADMPDGTYFPATIAEVTVHNLAKIGSEAFLQYGSLTTVNFPDVTEVGVNAFTQTKLTEVTAANFPKLETVQQQAFASITTLTAVNLPSAETLAQNAFLASQNISTIALPKVTSLGGRVFNSGNITSLTLPGAPPTIGGSNPFDGQGKDAVIIAFVAANGTALTGADLTAAISAYEQANDIETYNLWYGWRIKQPADVNSDGTIDIDDLEAIASSAYYNSKTTTGTQTFDVNGDGKINFADLALVRNSKNFGK